MGGQWVAYQLLTDVQYPKYGLLFVESNTFSSSFPVASLYSEINFLPYLKSYAVGHRYAGKVML